MNDDDIEFAGVILFEFILGTDEQNKIKAFNEILNYLDLQVRVFCGCSKNLMWNIIHAPDLEIAEKFFFELTGFYSTEQLEHFLLHGREMDLLETYWSFVDDYRVRLQTCRWIDEIEKRGNC